MLSMRHRLVIAGLASVAAAGALVLGSSPASAAAPTNVTGVTATALSATSVKLSWTPPTTGGFAGVHICRATGAVAPVSSCSGVNQGKAKGHTYTDTFQLLPNTQYTYGLFAYNASGVLASGASATVTTPSATPLPNVTGLTATPTATSVTLNWTDPASGTYASLYVCRAQGAVAPTLPCGGITLAASAVSYVDSNQLLPGTQYTYTVFSSDASGAGSSGTHVTTTTLQGSAPPNVTGLTATPTATSVTLNWTDPASGTYASLYVCRAQGAVAPTLPCGGITLAASAVSYVDSNQLLPGTQYTYTVFTSNASGVGSSGTHVTTTTLQGSAPPNVTGLTATPSSTSTSVTLNWTNPTPTGTFAGVYICRAQGAVAPTLPCGGVTVAAPTATYPDSFQLLPGTQYTYTVFSSTASGITSSGVSVTATTNP
jgi:titin